jgi:hypothetical protein
MKVRLTVQIRDAENHIRTTAHNDVELKDAATKASEIADALSKFVRQQKRAMATPVNGD